MKRDVGCPSDRITDLGVGPLRPGRRYVLYWMTRFRRTEHNFALERAVSRARELESPLLVVESLAVDEQWQSARFHRFALDGMQDNAEACARHGVTYRCFVESTTRERWQLLAELAASAQVVVMDDDPMVELGSLRRRLSHALRDEPVLVEVVDSNGLLPMRSTSRIFARAVDFRRHLQTALPEALRHRPSPRPLSGYAFGSAKVPASVLERFAATDPRRWSGSELDDLPIDREVRPVAARGGPSTARREVSRFVGQRIVRYEDDGRHPDLEATSGLSKYLRFGHVSPHDIFRCIERAFDHDPSQLSDRRVGQRSGYWGLPRGVEAFLDQLVTWRELGHNFCALRPDYRTYSSLPEWALRTLREHESDPRPFQYRMDQLRAAETHDSVWNAAQRQLLRDGEIHNSLRMLWGKKILEWSSSPAQALERTVELNDRYALDGRDPNSYSGIFWVFGRYDRAWGPERAIYGKVRYMSSENAARKLHLRSYLFRYAP